MVWLVALTISISLFVSVIITPVYAARTVEVTKEVGVKKELMEKTLSDLTSYKKVFPAMIKDVKVDPSDKTKAKFIVDAMGTREANVKSTIKDGVFTVDIVSGELKGSKMRNCHLKCISREVDHHWAADSVTHVT